MNVAKSQNTDMWEVIQALNPVELSTRLSTTLHGTAEQTVQWLGWHENIIQWSALQWLAIAILYSDVSLVKIKSKGQSPRLRMVISPTSDCGTVLLFSVPLLASYLFFNFVLAIYITIVAS